METRKPLVAEIKHNSLDDGPGIRTIVFFKGCPLSCVWCHNPECINSGPELLYRVEKCLSCRACHYACPEKAIGTIGGGTLYRDKCKLCGSCAVECPSDAMTLIGKYYSPDELVVELERDKAFYDNSGGGVTLSGGEPTLFMDYAAEIARKLKEKGIHVCIETCGDFDWERFAEKMLPHVSLVYVDMKFADEELHKKYTGRDNRRIKANIERLIKLYAPETLVRIPLIPEVTATDENLKAISAWLRDHGVKRIALLPYNPLWVNKSVGLGNKLNYDRESWMTQEERERVKNIFETFKVEREI